MADQGRVLAAFPAGDGDEEAITSMLARVEDGSLDVAAADAPRLATWLGHPERRVRRRAAGALAVAIRRGSIPAGVCEALLGSDDERRRWGAAFALGRAGSCDPRVIDVAVVTLDAHDGDVRWAAASMVIAAARVSAGLRERLRTVARTGSATARKMALLCLCDCGERDAAAYLAALGDVDALVRLAALTALGRIRDPSHATAAAIEHAAAVDAAAAVRRAAAAVLRRLAAADRTR